MRSGGKYRKTKNGKTTQVEPATKDHEKGNCARDKDGRALAPGIRAREADKTKAEEK